MGLGFERNRLLSLVDTLLAAQRKAYFRRPDEIRFSAATLSVADLTERDSFRISPIPNLEKNTSAQLMVWREMVDDIFGFPQFHITGRRNPVRGVQCGFEARANQVLPQVRHADGYLNQLISLPCPSWRCSSRERSRRCIHRAQGLDGYEQVAQP